MKAITESIFNKKIPVITAHAGCEGTHANSISHVRAALASGADFCEVDVYPHSGTLYLTHDKVDDFSKCPTLEECFVLCKNSDICFNCDMKVAGAVGELLTLAKKQGMEQRIVISGATDADDRAVIDSSALDRFIHPYTEGEPLHDSLVRYSAPDNGYRIMNIFYKDATEQIIAFTRGSNMGLSLWTVNDEQDIRRLLEAGAMNITTCSPVLALKIRNEIYGK